MKTLIDWAICVGNENEIGFTNERRNELKNENHFTNENYCRNENRNETLSKNENHLEMNGRNENDSQKICRNEPTLHTKWGTAKPNSKGYYRITSGVEGNNMKFLHRLIFEDYHRCTLLPEGQIHHIDGDKTNNCILNLELIHKRNHTLHHSAEKTTTGYFRVTKNQCPQCKQGFIYRYQYYDKGEKQSLWATTIEKLEKKVKQQNLEWRKLQWDTYTEQTIVTLQQEEQQ